MNQQFDVIVVGCGGVGSAVLDHLARRGIQVLGLEQFALGHGKGSSHGRTRIIREAYFEHPNYVPLVRDSIELWNELQADIGRTLLTPSGLLEVGPRDGIVIPGVTASAVQHGLRVDHFTATEAQREFPQFDIPDDCVGVFERDAGILHVDDCVSAHLERARRHGARIIASSPINEWSRQGDDFKVSVGNDTYIGRRLVIAGGAWSSTLLGELDLGLELLLKRVYWFRPHGQFQRFQFDHDCPIYYFELPFGHFYGFPIHDSSGMKTAEHSGGIKLAEPNDVDSIASQDVEELARVNRFLSDRLPNVIWRLVDRGNCFYTMSPDGHFVVDQHPQSDRVVFAAGLSGHGFKFTPVLGNILADAVLEQRWDDRVGFLRLEGGDRSGSQDT